MTSPDPTQRRAHTWACTLEISVINDAADALLGMRGSSYGFSRKGNVIQPQHPGGADEIALDDPPLRPQLMTLTENL